MLGCLLTLMLAVPSLQSELKILSTPDGSTHPPPCALTCTGVSKFNHQEEYWKEWSGVKSYKFVNIEGCGFVNTPVVTVTLKARTLGTKVRCPPIFLAHPGLLLFFVITGEPATPHQMVSNGCDVFWTANGFIC